MGIGSDMRLFTECPPLPPPTVAEAAAKLSILEPSGKWNRLRPIPWGVGCFFRDGAGKLWHWGTMFSRPAEPTASDLRVYALARRRWIETVRLAADIATGKRQKQ